MDNVLDGIIKDAFEAKKRGCFEKAKDHFYKVIRVQPRHAEANFNIGVFEMASKNISVAEKFLKIALEEGFINEEEVIKVQGVPHAQMYNVCEG